MKRLLGVAVAVVLLAACGREDYTPGREAPGGMTPSVTDSAMRADSATMMPDTMMTRDTARTTRPN